METLSEAVKLISHLYDVKLSTCTDELLKAYNTVFNRMSQILDIKIVIKHEPFKLKERVTLYHDHIMEFWSILEHKHFDCVQLTIDCCELIIEMRKIARRYKRSTLC